MFKKNRGLFTLFALFLDYVDVRMHESGIFGLELRGHFIEISITAVVSLEQKKLRINRCSVEKETAHSTCTIHDRFDP